MFVIFRLRIFNASKNRLINLPLLNENLDLNKVQELYLSNNLLGNNALEVISGYSRLKILHLAQNEITELDDQYVKIYYCHCIRWLRYRGGTVRR